MLVIININIASNNNLPVFFIKRYFRVVCSSEVDFDMWNYRLRLENSFLWMITLNIN